MTTAMRRLPAEISEVSVAVHRCVGLSAPPYELWVQGKLLDELGIRDDGRVRIEIIGGEVVVSSLLSVDHAGIVGDVRRALHRAECADPGFPWESAQNVDFNLERIAEGYIPDLVVMGAEDYKEARKTKARYITPKQLALAVEVTSKWNAGDDREPGPRRERWTKWNGYALVGIQYYLLVERDPRRLTSTLYTGPDSEIGVYTESRSWAFGETITLPEPFAIEIPTDEWEAWDEE